MDDRVWARAAWDFETIRPKEVSLVEGDVVEVLDNSLADWWQVKKIDGSTGRVPAAFMQVVDRDSIGDSGAGQATALASPVDAAGAIYVALHDWAGQHEEDLHLSGGDEIEVIERPEHGWWFGRNAKDGREGWFPMNYISPKNVAPPQPPLRPNLSRKNMGSGSLVSTGSAPSPDASSAPSAPSDALNSITEQAEEPAAGSGNAAANAGRTRTYAMTSLDAFDELMDHGVAVELPEGAALLDEPRSVGSRVTAEVTGYTWDGAQTQITEFASTACAGQPLEFSLGAEHVTAGLDYAVASLPLGVAAMVTCTPNTAYGDAGHPPSIQPHQHLVYEVTLQSVGEESELVTPPSGPRELLGAGPQMRRISYHAAQPESRSSRQVQLTDAHHKAPAMSTEDMIREAAGGIMGGGPRKPAGQEGEPAPAIPRRKSPPPPPVDWHARRNSQPPPLPRKPGSAP